MVAGAHAVDLRRTRASIALVLLVLLCAAILSSPTPAFAAKGGTPGKPSKPGTEPTTATPPPPTTPQPVVTSLSSYASPPGTQITVYGSDSATRRSPTTSRLPVRRATSCRGLTPRCVVQVPKKTQAGYVGVTSGDLTSNGMYFVPALQPELTSVSADEGDPGSTITLTGLNFGASQGAGLVTFAGYPAQVVSWSETEITVLVPDGPVGYVGIWQNDLCSNGVLFITGGRPMIGTLDRPFALTGDVVTVTGDNFGAAPESADSLTVGGQPFTPLSWSETSITFEAPSAVAGYVGVWRAGACSNGAFMQVAGHIDSLSSWWGAYGGDFTITGQGFGTTQDRVTIGGTDAGIVSWSDTQIVVSIPDGAPEGYVGVWSGYACSNGAWLLALAPPTISAVDTTTASPGQTIEITGADFGSLATDSRVTIGELDLEIISWSDDSITARVPESFTTAGYLGVWKRSVASGGVWVECVASSPATP